MELQITGHNVEITNALRETVTAKCKKLEQFFDKINSVQVILRIEKVSKIAEATAQVNGADLHASAEKEDMYAAIDEMAEKLGRQLSKHKEKLRNR
ncbi:ribosome hibernation promoting factor [Morganella morganii subsp. morganii]|uniref:ribosome hibernation promoting factor n=1 Tax=Morganella morganii TaxID=582 RepID=UPI001BD9D783|nr:ribosome hibernation promoting factor [Morganella morganii]MBT0445481.1 ribosome hibernation promoting factor [Morganella morganii subsp. morganii]